MSEDLHSTIAILSIDAIDGPTDLPYSLERNLVLGSDVEERGTG